jgi:hypothetical protein
MEIMGRQRHDAMMRRAFPGARSPESQARQYLAKPIDETLARPLERILQWHPPGVIVIRDFDFTAESEQADRAVAGGQRVGNIASQGAYVPDLRPADYAATFGQAATIFDDAVVRNDPAMCDAATDDDGIAFTCDRIQPFDARDIDHRLDRPMQPASRLYQQIGTAADDTCLPCITPQYLQRLVDRGRREVMLPAIWRRVAHGINESSTRWQLHVPCNGRAHCFLPVAGCRRYRR